MNKNDEVCPYWEMPLDRYECKGTCEIDSGDCVLPCDRTVWKQCPRRRGKNDRA